MPRCSCLVAALAAAVWALGLASVARAQQRTFYLDRIQVSGAPDDGIATWRPYMSEHTRFYGSFAVGYSLDPLRAPTLADDPRIVGKMEDPVRHQVIAYAVGGVELASRIGVNLSLPVALFQEGGQDPTVFGVGDGLARDAQAAHDFRADTRVKVLESTDRTFRFGIGGTLWFPTGNANSFGSDGTTTGMVYGTTEVDAGSFILAGHVGPHFRPRGSILGPNGKLTLGSELRVAAGIFAPMRDGHIRLGGELWGTTGIESIDGRSTFFADRNTTFEWLGSVRWSLDEDNRGYLLAGGGTRVANGYGADDFRGLVMLGTWASLLESGATQAVAVKQAPQIAPSERDTDKDGLSDDIDLCPTVKEDGKPPSTDDGCPAPADRDHDGIFDEQDACPDDPEDEDELEDFDGCPETDADGDGVIDTEDACPTKAGERSNEAEKNGCPVIKEPEREKRIVTTSTEIKLLEPIQFETGSATIKEQSFPVLDDVVDVMKSRPEVRVGVYGHTDSRGGRGMNLRLSKERAAAVVTYIASKGVAADRLESDGFGPDKPLEKNDTEEGRSRNRRVEFKILEK